MSRRYERLTHLFALVYELDAAERDRVLERECAGDEVLRSEVIGLLDSHEDAQSFLDGPALGSDFSLDRALASDNDLSGGRIHGCVLRRVIASGGMATVYEAEQDNPRRTVAVKVMRWGHASPSARRRFEYEAHILARLRHPGIAQVYEAGVYVLNNGMTPGTSVGSELPYFVMEYIPDALSITQFAAHKRFGVRERLELFASVCDAVHHGHQKGIIHRDLKPANILVDSSGCPKVIDFGVARATDSDIAVTTMRTNVGQLIGTIQYMSPEQCYADPDDLDTRSDVYSLGVVLFELLSGGLPYNIMGTSLHEAVRVVQDEAPTRLRSLDRTLGSDLETITLKALAKDRARRYQSAVELAQDVRRYLHDEPIIARPPSAWYLTRMFIRRHRATTAAAAAVVMALVLGLIGTAWQAAQAESARRAEFAERRRAEEALNVAELARAEEAEHRRLAERREAELEQVADFQASMLEGFDLELMGIHLRRDLLAEIELLIDRLGLTEEESARRRETLEWAMAGLNFTTPAAKGYDRNIIQRALETVERDFADQPLVQARLLLTLAKALGSLGRGGEARALQERAYLIRLLILGDDHPDTIAALAASARGGRPLAEAEVILLDVLDRRQRILGDDHFDTISSLSAAGRVIEHQGHLRRAEPYFRKALEQRRRTLGDTHPATLDAIVEMGVNLHHRNQLDEAEAHYREAMEGRLRMLGEEHPSTMKSKGNMAWLLHTRGLLEEAEPYLRETLDYHRRTLGDEHPHTLYTIAYLGELLMDMDRLEEAEVWYRESLEGCLKFLGESHRVTLIVQHGMGNLRYHQGRFEEAEVHLRAALDGRRTQVDNPSPLINTLVSMGRLLDAMDRFEEAEAYSREVAEIRQQLRGE